jgi:hypothetical protein
MIFTRWELMFLIVVGITLVLSLLNLARIAFGGRKPELDEHARHLGIGSKL